MESIIGRMLLLIGPAFDQYVSKLMECLILIFFVSRQNILDVSLYQLGQYAKSKLVEKNKHSSFLFLINSCHFDEYVSLTISPLNLNSAASFRQSKENQLKRKKTRTSQLRQLEVFFGKNKIYKWKWIQLFLIGALVWNTSVDAKS